MTRKLASYIFVIVSFLFVVSQTMAMCMLPSSRYLVFCDDTCEVVYQDGPNAVACKSVVSKISRLHSINPGLQQSIEAEHNLGKSFFVLSDSFLSQGSYEVTEIHTYPQFTSAKQLQRWVWMENIRRAPLVIIGGLKYFSGIILPVSIGVIGVGVWTKMKKRKKHKKQSDNFDT